MIWLKENSDEQDRVLSSTPTIAPAIGLITDGFGRRKDPFTGRLAFHRGLDISARRGTPVKAPADGIVVFAGRNGATRPDGAPLARFRLSRRSTGTSTRSRSKPGDEVLRGQEIGLLGNSGRSTGPHLHYEVHKEGKAENPLYYILDAF